MPVTGSAIGTRGRIGEWDGNRPGEGSSRGTVAAPDGSVRVNIRLPIDLRPGTPAALQASGPDGDRKVRVLNTLVLVVRPAEPCGA